MFKRGWWRYWDAHALPDDPEGLPLDWMWERVVTSWDMRFGDSQDHTTSYVVGQVWGKYRADRYLLCQVRARLGFTDTVKAVEAVHEAWPQATATLVERKANGDAVISQLRSTVPGLIPVEPEGGKDVRAAAVSPLVEAGNVKLPATDFIPPVSGYAATSVTDLIEEHAGFPAGSNDDQVDAMSQALTHLGFRRETRDPPPDPSAGRGASISGDILTRPL